jgi:ABC-type Na+ efflux pump permease subunit
MAIPAILLGLQISGWIFFLPGAMQGHCDFRHLYTAGYMLRTGHRNELYDYDVEQKFQDSLVSREAIALPFNHLAYEALLFIPYSYASYRSAYFLFLVTNIALMVFAIRLMAPHTRRLSSMFFWLPTVLSFTFLPVAAAFMQGQDSIIQLLLFCGALVLLFLACSRTQSRIKASPRPT